MTYTDINSVFDVKDLVDDLNSIHRSHAVVVVTPRADGSYPFDAAAITDGVHDASVKVYKFAEADLTYELTDALPPKLNVFGGAARLYPRGLAWTDDMVAAPLFFAVDDPVAMAKRQYTLIEKAKTFSVLPPRVVRYAHVEAPSISPHTDLSPIPRRIAELIPTPVMPAPEGAVPTTATDLDVTTSQQIAARDETIADRDATIADRDYTISTLQARVFEESERVARLTELFIATQENDRQARSRTAKAVERERELLIENADLKKKLSDERETRRTQVKGAKARITVASSGVPSYRPELFPDLDAAATFAIQSEWVGWVPASEKPTHLLPDYRLGDRFAQSLDDLDPAFQSKSLRAVVSVLTGLAIEKRQVHPLRVNSASPAVTRDDGSTCYRAYIEENVPSARRLHYWKLPDGTIELSRIVVHDDYQP